MCLSHVLLVEMLMAGSTPCKPDVLSIKGPSRKHGYGSREGTRLPNELSFQYIET